MNFITAHIGWFVAAAIVVIGLLLVGFKDTLRFSFIRTWTISGVTFDESIRRKVLWITPLAMLGVVIVAQLQRPFDELDAIQQTIKFSLFATGLVLVIAILILACTSLPREIENRVIYTIVTKPTTRLELILGKILGFARVSAAILILMGLFTYIYLHVRTHQMKVYIADRLERNDVSQISRPTLEHYLHAGLLNSKTFDQPVSLQMYARPPQPDSQWRWMAGDSDQNILVPFNLTLADLTPPGAIPGQAQPGAAGLGVLVRMDYQSITHGSQDQGDAISPATAPAATQPIAAGPPVPTTAATTAPAVPPAPPSQQKDKPQIQVQILNAQRFTAVPPTNFQGQPVTLPSYESGRPAQVYLPPDHAADIAQHMPQNGSIRIYVMVEGLGEGLQYKVGRMPVQLYVPGINGAQGRVINPAPSPSDPSQPSPPIFRGRMGTYGQQLPGGKDSQAVAVYQFRNAAEAAATGGNVQFELHSNIEREGNASEINADISNVSLVFYNRKSGKSFAPIMVTPESMRLSYINVPAEAVAGGNFDVTIRSLTEGHWLGLKVDSLRMVTADQPFIWNLFKSLLVMWLMSLLVITIAVFCSTFVSWPIAVVLTLVILLGHWCVHQMGDALGPEAGRSIVTGFGFQDAGTAKVVSKSMDAVAVSLQTIAAVLPDISQFSSTESIVQGVSLPASVLWDSVRVLLMFALPLGVLSFIILKYKEVAP